MKKICCVMALAVLGITVQAEELKFITVMSQPIGAVARLEALNEKRPAHAFFVNFCNEKATSGSIHSTGRVAINELRLTGDDVQVGSDETDKEMVYRITKPDGLIVQGKGSLAGAKLLAAEANPDKIDVDATVQINSNATFSQATIPSMLINGTTKIEKNKSDYSGYDLHWISDYKRDYKVGSSGVEETGSSYNSKLLSWRLQTGSVCSNAPSAGATTRTVKCSDRYGSSYEGTLTEKFNFTNCKWEVTSNTCARADLKWKFWGYFTVTDCNADISDFVTDEPCAGNVSPEGKSCDVPGKMCYTKPTTIVGCTFPIRRYGCGTIE